MPAEPIYFISGATDPVLVEVHLRAGRPVGLAVPQMTPTVLQALARVVHYYPETRGVPVFLDSGAFSEVEFSPEHGRLIVEDPIDWASVLTVYRDAAEILGPSLYLVAPDRVSYPQYTLRLWKAYGAFFRQLRKLTGANIIVPLQRGGGYTLAYMWRQAQWYFGRDVIAGIPSKKDATPLNEIAAFLTKARPLRLHFLGLGIRSKRAPEVYDLVARLDPGATWVAFDSVYHRAYAGPVMREIRDEARTEVLQEVYTDFIGEVAEWLTAKEAKQIADEAQLTKKQRAAWLRDPQGFLDSGDEEVVDIVGHYLNEAFWRIAQTPGVLRAEVERRVYERLIEKYPLAMQE